MDGFTSPGGCKCTITARMYAVCDEHGNHLFKSDGLSAHRPWMHEVMSTRRQKISGQNSEAINIWMHVVLLHTHGVSTVHTTDGVPCPLGSFLSDWWRQPDFEDRKRARQKLPSLMAENGNTCTTCAYISVQLLASSLHFIIASVSALTVSAVQIQMMDRLNEGWSLHTMYICTFSAWLNHVVQF